jgi:CRP-like cAMP-binding protein
MEQFTAFSDADRHLLNELLTQNQEHHGAREDIIREGEHSDDIHFVLSGLACRYKILENGTRQIMTFLIPGDSVMPRSSS